MVGRGAMLESLVTAGRRAMMLALVALAARPSAALSQAQVPQFRGDFGLNAGTQAPPGLIGTFFFNNYHAGHVEDKTGADVPLALTSNALTLIGEYSSNMTVL